MWNLRYLDDGAGLYRLLSAIIVRQLLISNNSACPAEQSLFSLVINVQQSVRVFHLFYWPVKKPQVRFDLGSKLYRVVLSSASSEFLIRGLL